MRLKSTFAIALGAGTLVAGLVAIATSSHWWWFLIASGGALFFGGLNLRLGRRSFFTELDPREPGSWATYLLYVYAGATIETLREISGLWTYAGRLSTIPGIAALVILGYPLLFTFTQELYVLAKRLTDRPWVAVAVACLLLITWNEIPNFLAPLWNVGPAHHGLMMGLLAVGYLVETLIAVAAHELPL